MLRNYLAAALRNLFRNGAYAVINIFGLALGFAAVILIALFVRDEYRSFFEDIPAEIERLYASPKYFLTGLDVSGHPISLRTVEKIFRQLNSGCDAATD